MVRIAPSVLSANFAELGADIRMLNASADLIHLDVMDGVFVPNISFGFPVIEAIASVATIPLDAHLMIADPLRYVERVAKVGAKMMSFHYEAVKDPAEVARAIRENGMSPGLAFNPDVPVADVAPWLEHFDFALLMSVFAGFGGQSFVGASFSRMKELKSAIDAQGLDCAIEVDGGVSDVNCAELVRCGADILVAGNFVFKSVDPAATIASLRALCTE